MKNFFLGQMDYIFFVGGLGLLIGGGVCWFLHKVKKDLSFGCFSKNLVVWPVVGLVVIVLGGWGLTERYGQCALAQEKEELLNLAKASVAVMKMEDVLLLTGTLADEKTALYHELKNGFRKIGDAVSNIRYVYLFGRRDGKVFFYLDTEPSRFWGQGREPTAKAGDIYDEADEDLLRVFEVGDATVVGPSADKWGNFVSALIPIRAVDGGPVKAVMGIDILVDNVFYQVRIWRLAAISLTLLFIGLYAGFFFLYLRERKLRDDIQRNEKKFHGLFREMLNGFALHELVFDGSGKAVDYRFLEVNNAFERLTGLKADKIIGRTAKEVLQGLEAKWVERYSAVALTGETVHFEEYNESLGKYFEVRAFCVVKGSQFAVTFEDVTKRKRAMEDLARMLIRIRHQQKAIIAIGRLNAAVSHQAVLENITTIAANAMDVARVSIWLGTLTSGIFECQDLFEREKSVHSGGMLLDAGQFPTYFKAIDSGRVIDAYDAHKDLRTLELVARYLKPAGISSVLHVAIKINGVLSGLLCFERIGEFSRWHMDETSFASEIAGQIEILLLARRQ